MTACCLTLLAPCAWTKNTADGVHCQIDQTTFDGDAELTRIDYVIPPGDKPPRFRLLAGHANDATGAISVELKFHGTPAGGTIELSLEPTWRSQTVDAHRGQCQFRLPIQVVNLGH